MSLKEKVTKKSTQKNQREPKKRKGSLFERAFFNMLSHVFARLTALQGQLYTNPGKKAK